MPEYVHFEELITDVAASRSHDIAPQFELAGDLPLVRIDLALGPRPHRESADSFPPTFGRKPIPATIRDIALWLRHCDRSSKPSAPGYRSENRARAGAGI